MSLIPNHNDFYTYSRGIDAVQSETSIKEARVINVTKQNHLSLTYDVELLDTGLVVEGCRVMTTHAGFNGVGTLQPIDEGTPVLVQFRNGFIQDGYIVGSFYTEGRYNSYYKEGKLQEPGELIDGYEYNQTSSHPNRVTQEDSYFKSNSSKIIDSPYDSPEYYSESSDKAAHRPKPSSIELRNQGGDIVQYSLGSNVIYSDGNIIQVSAGDKESKSTKLLKIAAMHQRRAELIENRYGLVPNQGDQNKLSSGVTPLVTQPNPTTDSTRFSLPTEYITQQERKLAQLYTEYAKAATQLAASRLEVANQMSQQHGNETPGNNEVLDGRLINSKYRPKEESSKVNQANYGDRFSKDANGNLLNNQPIVVIHETAGSASSALSFFQNPKAEASYHAIVKRDGTIVNLVPPTKRAFGAGNSDFKGETVATRSGAKPSVNNFAYHISLESPPDGYWSPGKNITSHSGYTEAQYQSLAYQVAKVGVPNNRITTHAEVDNNGNRRDPISFDKELFFRILAGFPRNKQISLGLTGEQKVTPVSNTSTTPTNTNIRFSDATSLVSIDGQRLHPEAANAYTAMKQAARKEGIRLTLVSGFRSIRDQQSIVDRKRRAGQTDAQIFRVNARPGYSEHHTGYALDVLDASVNTGLEASFDRTPAFRWLSANASRFGFLLSYPEANNNGITYEPWHWKFVGSQNARAIFGL